MKRLFTTLLACLAVVCMMAQGWPQNYGGVMLQGFYWDYYDDQGWGTWSRLESQADDLEGYIDLIWVPNSARTKNDYCVEHAQTEGTGWLKDMGYMPCFWLNHDNTIFGNATDLKSMINTFKAKGIGIIEDVVINHKNGQSSWCDFPDEHVTTTSGKTYELNWTLADICYNDNGGYVRTMFEITGAADTGDDFDGCRDLDHTGANVQKNVKTYLDYLQQELGYAGFRYDMVKGYGPQFVGIYNAYAKPTFSVGEFWDNWDGTTWWVNGTMQNGVIQSAAFDFPLKFLINNAFNGSFNQNALSSQGMAGSNDFKRYSVTFVDNHDTYRDDTKMSNAGNVLAANAFILSMPGTPCIFLPHWKDHKDALKRMIAARKAAGITNQSTFTSYECNNGNGRNFTVQGSNGKSILLLLGDCGYTPENDYRSVWNGTNFQMYVSSSVSEETLSAKPSGANTNLGTARVDMASGTYYPSVTVSVTASDPFTTLVYTEDGSDPTTSSATISSDGQNFTYDTAGTHKLKVGVKGENGVTDIQTYTYIVTAELPTDITIYVRADKEPIYLYAWDANGTLTSEWPGTQLSAKKSANGQNFYYMTFPKASADYTLNYILNQGSDGTKTPDQMGIGSTIFTALGDGATIDLTATYAGATITDPVVSGAHDITVFVEANRYPLKLYAWDNSGDLNGVWPGQQMSHTACINNKTWFYETFSDKTSIGLIVSDGNHQSANFENVTGNVYVSYDGGDRTSLFNKTADYAGYPQAWYEQGEICAFFVDDEEWGNIHAWAWDDTNNNNYNYTGGSWPGESCSELGYNENGNKIYKWHYGGELTTMPKYIIFNNNNGKQTANCDFVNGAWYNSSNSNTGSNTTPISTDVTPSTEIALADLGESVTATNWNGVSEKVAEKNGEGAMTKDFILDAGDYIVQAIVRGTNGSSLTLSVEGQSASVELKGMEGATSTVQTNGIVETYATGANNGWHKVEVAFTLGESKKTTVTLSSTADTWQLGALKMLPGSTKTVATTGVDLATNTFVDVRGTSDYSFFERGANCNALIKAAAATLPAQLPYNVIVDGTCAYLKLTDGNYSFHSNDEFTANNASYDRTFVPGQRSTICLPFALTAEEAAAAGTFWELDSYNDGKIRFTKVEETVANYPYIFEAATAQPFHSVSAKSIPVSSLMTVTKDGISFLGVNERTNLMSVENGLTYYGYRQSDASFVKVGTTNGANINPFRAYLQTSTPLQARMPVSFGEEDESALGVQEVLPAATPMKQLPIYNISGQRVLNPQRKGLYIVGGKKYFVKK